MPVYCHATAITGMSILGKISVGVRRIMTGLKTKISTARTMKVYGLSRATRTIHICRTPYAQIATLSRVLEECDETERSQDARNFESWCIDGFAIEWMFYE